jgi:hypothetical protein
MKMGKKERKVRNFLIMTSPLMIPEPCPFEGGEKPPPREWSNPI